MSTSQVNMRLTNYAYGIAQDLQRALARFICPTVPTGGAHGQFKKFDDRNAFQIYETGRALGGESRTIEFSDSDPYFNCAPQGLKIPIDEHERKLAGDNDKLLEEAKVKTLVSSAVLSHENKVFETVFNAISAEAGKGVWSSDTVDPVAQIDEQIQAIADDTGVMPNRMVMGLSAWRVFKEHPLVKARQPGAALQALTMEQACSLFLNPQIQMKVGVLSKNIKKFGAAANKVNIVGAEVLIFYAEDSPSLYDPSAFKCFSTRDGGVDAVKSWYDNNRHSDMYEVGWSEDIQSISTLLAKRISLS